MKKIILTETQLQRVIDKFITEQTTTSQNIKPIKQFNITNSFSSGKFQLTTTEEIDAAINEINDIVLKTPNTKYDVVVTSSESKVPNRGVGLKPGELSLKRGQAAELYIKEKLGNKVNFKMNNLGAQGPEWVASNGNNNPEYTKFQYVTISLVVSASQTTANVDDICTFKFNGKGTQGVEEKNYITLRKTLKGKGQISMTTGTIPDRMIIVDNKNTITKDTGYVATQAHKYTKYKYVPIYVAGLTKLIGSSAVSGGKLITFNVTTFEELMKTILINPDVIPTSQEMIKDGREVSDGITSLKELFKSGVRTFAIYEITPGSTSLNFDTDTNDKSIIVISPLGQTGYEITGRC